MAGRQSPPCSDLCQWFGGGANLLVHRGARNKVQHRNLLPSTIALPEKNNPRVQAANA
jgi:hypothetical protein